MNQKTKDYISEKVAEKFSKIDWEEALRGSIQKEIARQLSIHPGGLVYTSDPATYEQDEKVWPQEEDTVWYVDPLGYLKDFVYAKRADILFKKLQAQGNAFPTEEEAKAHSLRQKAMANTWRPKKGETYYYWDFKRAEINSFSWYSFNLYYEDVDYDINFLGNCHPTKEAAQEWGEKYHDAFMKKIK
jgi:hypothetical protein